MIIRILAVVILVLASLASWATDTASACSCGRSEPREEIERTTASFVGRIISRIDSPIEEGRRSENDHVIFTFAVDEIAKGDLTDFVVVRAPLYGSFCGFEGPILDGARTGVILRLDEDGNYTSNLCSTMDISDMRSVVQLSEPEPNLIVHHWIPKLTTLLRRLFVEFLSEFDGAHFSARLELNYAQLVTRYTA